LKRITIILTALLTVLTTSISSALELTPSQAIGTVETTAGAQQTFLVSANGTWGVAACPQAVFVVLTSASPSYKELLAIALTAKAGEINVSIFGNCAADPFYFTATQIRLD